MDVWSRRALWRGSVWILVPVGHSVPGICHCPSLPTSSTCPMTTLLPPTWSVQHASLAASLIYCLFVVCWLCLWCVCGVCVCVCGVVCVCVCGVSVCISGAGVVMMPDCWDVVFCVLSDKGTVISLVLIHTLVLIINTLVLIMYTLALITCIHHVHTCVHYAHTCVYHVCTCIDHAHIGIDGPTGIEHIHWY